MDLSDQHAFAFGGNVLHNDNGLQKVLRHVERMTSKASSRFYVYTTSRDNAIYSTRWSIFHDALLINTRSQKKMINSCFFQCASSFICWQM